MPLFEKAGIANSLDEGLIAEGHCRLYRRPRKTKVLGSRAEGQDALARYSSQSGFNGVAELVILRDK